MGRPAKTVTQVRVATSASQEPVDQDAAPSPSPDGGSPRSNQGNTNSTGNTTAANRTPGRGGAGRGNGAGSRRAQPSSQGGGGGGGGDDGGGDGDPDPDQNPDEGTEDEEEEPNAAFALNPNHGFDGVLNFSKKHHRAIYNSAIASLYADPKDRYNLDASEAQTLLQKVRDRCDDCNIAVIEVPATHQDVVHRRDGNPYDAVNLCDSHGTVEVNQLTFFVRSFIGQPVRDAQDDNMLAIMLQQSLTEHAYQVVTRDASRYTVRGRKSGLLWLKVILDESAIASSVDPMVVREEIAYADAKFQDLGCNVRLFNDWIQLKMNQLRQKGTTSSDAATHVIKAYKASNVPEFIDYVNRLEDQYRDNGMGVELRDLMDKAKSKFDAIEKQAQVKKISSKKEEELNALEAIRAEIKDMKGKLGKRQKDKKGKGGKEKKNGKGKKSGKDKKFPKELKKKPKPDDLTKPVEINGTKYYYCEKHKWCRHLNSDCKGIERRNEGQQETVAAGNGNNNDRNGRTVRAVNAVISDRE